MEQEQLNTQAESSIRTLIELGKTKGFLTNGEINDILPDNLGTPDKLEDVFAALEELGIDVVDDNAEEDEDEEKQAEEAARTAEAEMENEATQLESIDDPLRMYLLSLIHI